MAVDMFLKINGIEGESSIKKHEGEIELLSFSWGLSQPSSSTGGGGGAGKVQVQDFSFVKTIDASSPKLMEACCSGQHLHDVTLTLATREKPQEFLKIKFSDVLISSYQTGGGATGGMVPVDQVSFNFRQIEVQSTGGKGSPAITCDFSSNEFVKLGHNH